MKAEFSVLVLLLAVTSLPQTAPSQVLWNGSVYGMTEAQVQSTHPSAAPPKSEMGHLADGSEELLRIEPVKLLNERFEARHYFREGRLTQVTLSLRKGSFDTLLLTYNALLDALRAKYGKELSSRTKRGFLDTAQAEWMTPKGVNVSVFALSLGPGEEAVLNINYQKRLADDLEKL